MAPRRPRRDVKPDREFALRQAGAGGEEVQEGAAGVVHGPMVALRESVADSGVRWLSASHRSVARAGAE